MKAHPKLTMSVLYLVAAAISFAVGSPTEVMTRHDDSARAICHAWWVEYPSDTLRTAQVSRFESLCGTAEWTLREVELLLPRLKPISQQAVLLRLGITRPIISQLRSWLNAQLIAGRTGRPIAYSLPRYGLGNGSSASVSPDTAAPELPGSYGGGGSRASVAQIALGDTGLSIQRKPGLISGPKSWLVAANGSQVEIDAELWAARARADLLADGIPTDWMGDELDLAALAATQVISQLQRSEARLDALDQLTTHQSRFLANHLPESEDLDALISDQQADREALFHDSRSGFHFFGQRYQTFDENLMRMRTAEEVAQRGNASEQLLPDLLRGLEAEVHVDNPEAPLVRLKKDSVIRTDDGMLQIDQTQIPLDRIREIAPITRSP